MNNNLDYVPMFRAYDLDERKYFSVGLLEWKYDSISKVLRDRTIGWSDDYIHNYILEQFIGLYDCDKLPVYVGDRLQLGDKDQYALWIVVFYKGNFCAYNEINPSNIFSLFEAGVELRKIVGTVHDKGDNNGL